MKKKNIILISVFIGAGILFSSCSDYLDSDKYFEDRITINKVFTSKQRSQQWLAYAFSFLKNENADVVGKEKETNSFTFADDMYYGDRDVNYDSKEWNELSYNTFMQGQYNEDNFNQAWTMCYKGIYQASVFINNIDMNTEMTDKERLDYKGQARFVRAYYYWLLLRRYGPVPIVPNEGIDYTQSYEQIAIPRNSYEEVVDYISNEMIQAAKEIQYTKRDGENCARPTKGACLATRALALIYSASPLANGNNDTYAKSLVDDKGKALLNSTYKEEKWAKAAAACKDVMELGVYDLYHASFNTTEAVGDPKTIVPADSTCIFAQNTWPKGWKDIDPFKSYRVLFSGDIAPEDNTELIFSRIDQNATEINHSMKSFARHSMPRDFGGWNTHGLTQKMVDAYYMNDGSDCPGKDRELNGGNGTERLTGFTTLQDYRQGKYKPLAANVSLQYANREPRFYASVGYNGSVWEYLGDPEPTHHNRQTFYYRGSGNGYNNSQFYLRTGISVKKYVNQTDVPDREDYRNIKDKAEPAIRYADILLLYAEALNELEGTYSIASWDKNTTYTIQRNIEEIQKGIHPIRIRGGVPDYDAQIYSNKNLLRDKIKRERMIEFMGEGKRYFDLRRWKDAPKELNQQIYGCNIMMDANHKSEFHQIIPINNLRMTFSDRMYFWPIRHSELKHNSRLTQNPGWTYND
ncbi:RagB/SusD family nutrient uptake outer membrane protein [Hoylesella nanceiensis]|uniref:RagB/SusD family nutrient uptake outer membrane protein n=1 Tax=Hoylesella nanceiensis TaxID=425941 RepID=UPI001C5E7386|nr:RagB/SusD family nutrient uptake outer membrane protein [Hoylesella nanceiensis]MBW4767552.1 RagB/SusD family nutrient uptake outer membrane protein [Hoylesella nanceiensis]